MEIRNRLPGEQEVAVSAGPEQETVPPPSSSAESYVTKVRACATGVYQSVESLAQYKIARPFVWTAKLFVWALTIRVKQSVGIALAQPCQDACISASNALGLKRLTQADLQINSTEFEFESLSVFEKFFRVSQVVVSQTIASSLGLDPSSPEDLAYIDMVCTIPVLEELFFRYTVQGLLLTELPKVILKRVSPGKVGYVDSKIARVFRITLVSTLFSAYHLINRGIVTDNYLQHQLVGCFVMGLWLGVLKETRLGTSAALGLHGRFNMISAKSGLLGFPGSFRPFS